MCSFLNFCKAPLLLWKCKFHFLILSRTHALPVCKALSLYSRDEDISQSSKHASGPGLAAEVANMMKPVSKELKVLWGPWLSPDISKIEKVLWKIEVIYLFKELGSGPVWGWRGFIISSEDRIRFCQVEKKEKIIPGQENYVQSARSKKEWSTQLEGTLISQKTWYLWRSRKGRLPLRAGELCMPVQGHTSQSLGKRRDVGNS